MKNIWLFFNFIEGKHHFFKKMCSIIAQLRKKFDFLECYHEPQFLWYLGQASSLGKSTLLINLLSAS